MPEFVKFKGAWMKGECKNQFARETPTLKSITCSDFEATSLFPCLCKMGLCLTTPFPAQHLNISSSGGENKDTDVN